MMHGMISSLKEIAVLNLRPFHFPSLVLLFIAKTGNGRCACGCFGAYLPYCYLNFALLSVLVSKNWIYLFVDFHYTHFVLIYCALNLV